MVRTYKRKTDKPRIDEATFKRAIKAVLRGTSIRKAAEQFGIKKSTLGDRIKNKKIKRSIQTETIDSGNSSDDSDTGLTVKDRDKFKVRQFFSSKEVELKKYLMFSSKINFGLTYLQTRQLAYEYAVQANKKMYSSWERNKIAGEDWMLGFMRRHSDLSLRAPENTSLARAISFNKTNVEEFFSNYKGLVEKFELTADKIYNIDETGITTVLPNPKVNIKFKIFTTFF